MRYSLLKQVTNHKRRFVHVPELADRIGWVAAHEEIGAHKLEPWFVLIDKLQAPYISLVLDLVHALRVAFDPSVQKARSKA